MGQEEREARILAPLVLGGDEEVVDDDLCAVDEVAELCLPGNQRVRGLDRIAVLKADRGVFREQRIADREVAHFPRGLERLRADATEAIADVSEGDVFFAVRVVNENVVTLAERAAPCVLTG